MSGSGSSSLGAGKDAEGAEWVARAEKKKKSFQFWSTSRYEEAAEMFQKAAQCFKLAKNWTEAGRAYMSAADSWLKFGKDNGHEAAENYINASGCFKKVSAADAVDCLERGIQFYMDLGRYQMCAKYHKEIGEICEGDHKYPEAIANYENAAQLFESENSTTHANQCKIKVADIAARVDDFDRAISTYVEVAQNSDGPTRFQIKKYLFHAGLCHLCLQDLIGTRRAIEEFQDIDPQFAGSRECQLLRDLCDAVEASDAVKFATDCHEYDTIYKLDAWETSALVKVKNAMGAGGAGGDDDDDFT